MDQESSKEQEDEVMLTVRVSAALAHALDEIAEETGRSRSDLQREALTTLIGMYRDAR